MRYYLGFLTCFVLLAACSDKAADFKPRNQMSQREKDSILGASSLPGAPVVRRALGAADVSAARQAAIDSSSQDN